MGGRGSALAKLRKTTSPWPEIRSRHEAKAKEMKKRDRQKAKDDGSNKSAKKVRRAVSAYVFFVRERHAALKLKQPDLRFGDASKLLGSEWPLWTSLQKPNLLIWQQQIWPDTQKKQVRTKNPSAKSAYVFFVRERSQH